MGWQRISLIFFSLVPGMRTRHDEPMTVALGVTMLAHNASLVALNVTVK